MMLEKIRELYRYRWLISALTVNELKLRYRRSFFGFFWTLLNPLLMMTVLTVVFSNVMRFSAKDYAILLLSGLLPWTFFSQSITQSLSSVVGKGALLRQVYIPKAVIPISTVAAALVNFSLSLIPLLLIAIVIGHGITKALFVLPLSILILALLACGFAFLFACLNVFFRDFGHMTEVLLQALFYASPIIYTRDMIPEKYQSFFDLNPLSGVVDCFRMPLYYGHFPPASTLAVAFTSSAFVCVIGFAIYTRFEHLFVLRA